MLSFLRTVFFVCLFFVILGIAGYAVYSMYCAPRSYICRNDKDCPAEYACKPYHDGMACLSVQCTEWTVK
jgi:hypothetical protein